MPDPICQLRLFIDSIDEQDWKAYWPTGLFYGITTNPKLLAAAGREFDLRQLSDLAGAAFEVGAKEIHLQVWGRDAEEMLQVGFQLAELDPRVMVKVPITEQGLRCARELISAGNRVTLTALHSAKQAVLAAALGAAYAAPYLGRMNDGGLDGIGEIITMQRILEGVGSPLRLLVASIRQISDLVTLAGQGLHAFTLLPPLIDELMADGLTLLAAESFQAVVDQDLRRSTAGGNPEKPVPGNG